jgi:uncharacterized membrane protein YidH (DUF202 family)
MGLEIMKVIALWIIAVAGIGIAIVLCISRWFDIKQTIRKHKAEQKQKEAGGFPTHDADSIGPLS